MICEVHPMDLNVKFNFVTVLLKTKNVWKDDYTNTSFAFGGMVQRDATGS
jgi:hypothetical protein